MGWVVKDGYNKVFQSDDLESVIDFTRKILTGNSLMKKGKSIEIEVTHSEWDTRENDPEGER